MPCSLCCISRSRVPLACFVCFHLWTQAGHGSVACTLPAPQVHAHDYAASLPKDTWLAMVAAKFWSTFSHCTPAELEHVCLAGLDLSCRAA